MPHGAPPITSRNDVFLPPAQYTEHNAGFASQVDVIPGVWKLRELMYAQRPVTSTHMTRPKQWALLRSRWRFLHAIYPYLGPPSYLLSRLYAPLLAIMSVAILVISVGRYTFSKGALSFGRPGLFLEIFFLSSFAMSLMLGFRINKVYDRWLLGRTSFLNISTQLRAAMHVIAMDVKDPYLLGEFERWFQLCHLSVLQLLQDREEPDRRTLALLRPDDLAAWRGSRKPRQLVLMKLNLLCDDAKLKGPEQGALNWCLDTIATDTSVCARIALCATPYAVTLHSTGFVFVWCLMLPLGLFPTAGWDSLLALAVAIMLLLGTDEVACQMENPFPHMPLEEMVCTTLREVPRVMDEVKLGRALMAQVQARAAAVAAAAAANGAGGLDKAADAAADGTCGTGGTDGTTLAAFRLNGHVGIVIGAEDSASGPHDGTGPGSSSVDTDGCSTPGGSCSTPGDGPSRSGSAMPLLMEGAPSSGGGGGSATHLPGRSPLGVQQAGLRFGGHLPQEGRTRRVPKPENT